MRNEFGTGEEELESLGIEKCEEINSHLEAFLKDTWLTFNGEHPDVKVEGIDFHLEICGVKITSQTTVGKEVETN